MSLENRRPVAHSGGGAPDLLERSAESVYHVIQQAPDLELAGAPPAPPEVPGGDHLPERDWAVIGLLLVIVVVGTHTTVRAALQLWREFRG